MLCSCFISAVTLFTVLCPRKLEALYYIKSKECYIRAFKQQQKKRKPRERYIIYIYSTQDQKKSLIMYAILASVINFEVVYEWKHGGSYNKLCSYLPIKKVIFESQILSLVDTNMLMQNSAFSPQLFLSFTNNVVGICNF